MQAGRSASPLQCVAQSIAHIVWQRDGQSSLRQSAAQPLVQWLSQSPLQSALPEQEVAQVPGHLARHVFACAHPAVPPAPLLELALSEPELTTTTTPAPVESPVLAPGAPPALPAPLDPVVLALVLPEGAPPTPAEVWTAPPPVPPLVVTPPLDDELAVTPLRLGPPEPPLGPPEPPLGPPELHDTS